ncbi:hypothetical protein [Bacillus mojavensis]|uniref:hypothetical protein n=1 Tax=Bacillus mojavensis TaxID=72360 RepID=UPI00227F6EE1|nr:hypothetical protein [Bacillus mojavensis]MCY9187744.1 hypothetical protein [Bacillus mojavensis]
MLDDHEYLAAYITEETLDEEGYPQNEDLLSVATEALTYKKTGDDDWDDEVYDELLDTLEQKGLAEQKILNWIGKKKICLKGFQNCGSVLGKIR